MNGGKSNANAIAFGKVPQDMIARFGKLDPFLWHELCKLAARLHSWRGDVHIPSDVSPTAGDGDQSDEYGADSNFSFEFLNSLSCTPIAYGERKTFDDQYYNKDLYKILNINRLKSELRRKTTGKLKLCQRINFLGTLLMPRG